MNQWGGAAVVFGMLVFAYHVFNERTRWLTVAILGFMVWVWRRS